MLTRSSVLKYLGLTHLALSMYQKKFLDEDRWPNSYLQTTLFQNF